MLTFRALLLYVSYYLGSRQSYDASPIVERNKSMNINEAFYQGILWVRNNSYLVTVLPRAG
jgi:hypothetical protein